MTTIPINIICYDNYKYVALMILQLTSILVDPDIRIIDNGSTDPLTIEFLVTTNYPVTYMGNVGPTIWYYIYDDMPDLFVVTDADLIFDPDMPNTFLDDLTTISNYYGSWKTGLALRIDDYPLMYTYNFETDCGYTGVYDIYTGQSQYWTNQYSDPNGYTVYGSPVDTTFFLFNKNNPTNPPQQDTRLAGEFQLRVLSWYVNIDDIYSDGGGISRLHRYLAHINDYPDTFYTIRCFELKYLDDNNIYPAVKDIDSVGYAHLVQLDLDSTGNDDFWQNVYPTDYNQIFTYYDNYLNPNKVYIDVGSWLGDTVFYPSRNSKRVIAVEPDSRVADKLETNIALSQLETPFILERSALYSSTELSLPFCQQENPETDSTASHLDSTCLSPTSVPGISFSDLLDKYSVGDVSMINVNINGDEENVLQDLYDYSSTNDVRLYVTFYYSVWLDSDLDRFTFLTTEEKTAISSGIVSILF
jgi:FkbM family methyltransferase